MRFIYIFIFVLCAQVVAAQDFDKYFYASWNYKTPLSDTNWLGDASAKGLKLGYRKIITDRFSVGFDYTWSAYEEYKPTATFVTENSAITTDYFNDLYSYGLTLNGQYFLPVNSTRVLPFVGIGLGATLNRYAQNYNIYTDDDSSWGFLARPEVGVLLAFGGKVGIIAGAHYDYTTASSDFFELSDFSAYGFNLGLVLMSY